jgi:hypothetical protein
MVVYVEVEEQARGHDGIKMVVVEVPGFAHRRLGGIRWTGCRRRAEWGLHPSLSVGPCRVLYISRVAACGNNMVL